MIVAIDGPAGSGKTTVAKRLAERLGYRYLDSGAMYRAVTLKSLHASTPPVDEAAWARLVGSTRIELDGARVLLDGRDVTEAIRRPEVTDATRRAAGSPAVRRRLGELQREFGRDGRLVAEGRDMSTVVFPDAPLKFYLTASPEERARRRARELAAKGHACSLGEVLAAQNERDQRDSQRELAPLTQAPDAVLIDTTGKTVDEVVGELKRMVQECDRA